jgi:hypothetical protein
MTNPESHGAAKVHPTARELLPDDPMEMTGIEIPGDTSLMLRLLVEEYARIGWGLDEIMGLARNSNYQAFHGLLQLYGEEQLCARVKEVLARCGVMRVKTTETAPVSERLVQIEIN